MSENSLEDDIELLESYILDSDVPQPKASPPVIDLTIESDEERPQNSSSFFPAPSRPPPPPPPPINDSDSDDDIVILSESTVQSPAYQYLTHGNSSVPSGQYIPPQPLRNHVEAVLNTLAFRERQLMRSMEARTAARDGLQKRLAALKEVRDKARIHGTLSSDLVKLILREKQVFEAAVSSLKQLEKEIQSIRGSISFVKANPQSVLDRIEKSRAQLYRNSHSNDSSDMFVNKTELPPFRDYNSLPKTEFSQFPNTHAAVNPPFPQLLPRPAGMPFPDDLEDVLNDISKLIDNIKPSEETVDDLSLPVTPPEFNITLLKHQRLGLEWLLKMECEAVCKGGILADDMGLGKTVQAMSIILANKGPQERKTTLIIGPVALLRQWKSEFETKIRQKDKLLLFMYHADDKVKLFAHLARYDIVLTSYGTLSLEYKKHFAEFIKECQNSNHEMTYSDYNQGGRRYRSPFYENRAIFHRVILDEAHIIKNKKTLVLRSCAMLRSTHRLCLSGTPIQNNVEELYLLLRFLRVKPYCEEKEFRRLIVLPMKSKSSKYDRSDHSNAMMRLQVLLKAVLLRRTKSHKIDGKPILNLTERTVNKVEVEMKGDEKDFYSTLAQQVEKEAKKLLATEKIGNYLSVLTLLLRLRQACCHSFLVRIGDMLSQIRDTDTYSDIDQLLAINSESGEVSLNEKIRNMVKKCKLFKEDQVLDIKLQMDSGESTCQACYEGLTAGNTVLLYPCGHPVCQECVEAFFENNAIDEHLAECGVCKQHVKREDMVHYEVFIQVFVLKNSEQDIFKHFGYSNENDSEELNTDEEFMFPVDREKIDKDSLAVLRQFYPHLNSYSKLTDKEKVLKSLLSAQNNVFHLSPKMDKCLEIIQKVFDTAPDEKVIVFSQFTLFFDLFGLVLTRYGIDYLRYDGSMNVENRDACIKEFYAGKLRVLLISLKAGNVGLTLTCANHVIIMDPFWNPFVEEQAMDRAHRIGQLKPVFVYRLLIENTVEDRIMALQEQKRELVENALNEKVLENISRLGRRELRYLLGIGGRP